MENKNETKQNYKILPDESLGPLGLGDPYSTRLRTVEIEVMIPKLMREKAKKVKCLPEYKEFEKCCKDHYILNFHYCKPEAKKMFECCEDWYHNEEFRKECTKEYLEKRKEYRLTGKTEKMRRLG